MEHVYDLLKTAGWKMVPCSCTCGGDTAWLKPVESGAYEMVGCTCHFTISSQEIIEIARDLYDKAMAETILSNAVYKAVIARASINKCINALMNETPPDYKTINALNSFTRDAILKLIGGAPNDKITLG